MTITKLNDRAHLTPMKLNEIRDKLKDNEYAIVFETPEYKTYLFSIFDKSKFIEEANRALGLETLMTYKIICFPRRGIHQELF